MAGDFFRLPEAPTSIVAWNDHEALSLLGILQHAGRGAADLDGPGILGQRTQ